MTTFAYLPVTRPELPSRMLQKAYAENLPLVGPEGTVSPMYLFSSTSTSNKVIPTVGIHSLP